MTYVIAQPCIEEKNASCVEVCPVACIHTTPDSPQYYIDPDVCIECEQCEIVCPVNAIFLDYKLPADWRSFIDVNASFFRRNKAQTGPPPLEVAWAMIHSAQAYATEVGARVSVAVVDEAGYPVAIGRMDGARPHTAELALSKAITSASFWLSSIEVRAQARRPWFQGLVTARRGRILAAGGGMPIAEGADVFGAIGVDGGRDDEQNVLCARAGMAAMEGGGH
jgi:ferredoxin